MITGGIGEKERQEHKSISSLKRNKKSPTSGYYFLMDLDYHQEILIMSNSYFFMDETTKFQRNHNHVMNFSLGHITRSSTQVLQINMGKQKYRNIPRET